jgi:hypothetical protein
MEDEIKQEEEHESIFKKLREVSTRENYARLKGLMKLQG